MIRFAVNDRSLRGDLAWNERGVFLIVISITRSRVYAFIGHTIVYYDRIPVLSNNRKVLRQRNLQ